MTVIVVGKDRISLLESERYVSGTRNLYEIKVSFSEDWNVNRKQLLFRTQNGTEIAVDVTCVSEAFQMPSELFKTPTDRLQVGAYGFDSTGQVVLNTPWTTIGRVVSGASSACDCGCGCGSVMPSKPSPVTYEQLKLLIDRKADSLVFGDGQFILKSGEDILTSFPAPVSVPNGGTKDQVLAKASDDDGDFYWRTVDDSSNALFKLPIGAVLAWSGSIDEIPESYALCNGENGTIDLRDCFLLGASEANPPGVDGSLEEGGLTRSVVDGNTSGSNVKKVYAIAFIQKVSFTEEDLKENKTAYEIAVENGFEGTEAEWLESLKGQDGKSAYEIVVEHGYTGSEQDFADSLTSTIELLVQDKTITSVNDLPAKANGSYIFNDVTLKAPNAEYKIGSNMVYVDQSEPGTLVLTTLNNRRYTCTLTSNGTIQSVKMEDSITTGPSDPSTSTPGPKGDSAYQVAVNNGFQGTEKEWLESLKGSKGSDGLSAYQIAVNNGFEGSEAEWLESLKGQEGKSAYDIAVENGFEGTEEEFTKSLTATADQTISDQTITSAKDLDTGSYILDSVTVSAQDGTSVTFTNSIVSVDKSDPSKVVFTTIDNIRYVCPVDSSGNIQSVQEETLLQQIENLIPDSVTGKDGKSAYDIAVENGFNGTEAEWLESLKGSDGLSAYQTAQTNGFKGTEAEWLESLQGVNGKSAYQLAVDNGFEGTEEEWLESLTGDQGLPGLPGKSAYGIAVENGFEGTEQEWLETLKGGKGEKGDNGLSAYEIAVEGGYEGTPSEWLQSLRGQSLQTVDDYTQWETIVGRWSDKRPVYRRMIETTITVSDTSTVIEVLPNIELTNAITGVLEIQNGSRWCSIPGIYGGTSYGLSYVPDTGAIELYATDVTLYEATIRIIFEYTKLGDAELSDDQLIVNPGTSSGGTIDHRELINRDAINQHPISSVTGLEDRLSVVPVKTVTNEQIDGLFE